LPNFGKSSLVSSTGYPKTVPLPRKVSKLLVLKPANRDRERGRGSRGERGSRRD